MTTNKSYPLSNNTIKKFEMNFNDPALASEAIDIIENSLTA